MFKPKTYAELCAAMQTGAAVQINRTVGVIDSLGREDGSGRCWIATITPPGMGMRPFPERVKEFIRTE